MAPACDLMGISVRTFERWQLPQGRQDRRKLAKRRVANKLSSEERQEVLRIANSVRFQDLPPCKIVPLLADEKKYIASESSFYRILKQENQMTHRAKQRPVKHHRPKEYMASAPCQVWSWDITYLPTQVKGLYFYLYMIIDIYSRKIVGFRVHTEESGLHAARLIEQACIDESVSPNQLILHSDNGSPMKSATLNATLKRLGVIPSFSRPSVSDDNPYSEALFKTMKYRQEFPSTKRFTTLNNATTWCEWFTTWYNNEHLHSELKFISPADRHSGKDKAILKNRHLTYLDAKNKNPCRWSGRKTRNWQFISTVSLNPKRKANNSIEIDKRSGRMAA